MARIQTWIIAFLASLVLVSGALGQRPTPITDPTHRLEFQGFSILPPSGKDWFIVVPQTVPDPSAETAVFFKVVGKMHSIGASVRIYAPIATQTLQDLESFVLKEAKGDPRFKPLKTKTSLDKCLGYDCVRIDLLFEDHAPRDFPGTVLMLTRQGFIVPHPDTPGIYIWVEYSQRFPPGRESYPVETELEPLLKNLVFTPIRQTKRLFTDNFSDDCSWPRGETGLFSFRCEQGAYRMRPKKPGPINVSRNFRWDARSVSVEVDATLAGGRGFAPGAALLGIGCLVDPARGYVAILRTDDGAWAIMRLEKDFRRLAGNLSGTNNPGDIPGLGRTNRLRIACAGGSGKVSVVSFFVNGQKVVSLEDKQGYAPFNGVLLYADPFLADVVFERFVAREPSEEDVRAPRP